MHQCNNERRNSYVTNDIDSITCINIVIDFLKLFIPVTTAKKLVSVILIAIGMPITQISQLLGLSERSIQSTGRAIKNGSINDVLLHKKSSGRKTKTANVENQIVEELENGEYHTRQQIADMINEKFKIKISLPSVGKLLKKRF